jgi:hypothetical protein
VVRGVTEEEATSRAGR